MKSDFFGKAKHWKTFIKTRSLSNLHTYTRFTQDYHSKPLGKDIWRWRQAHPCPVHTHTHTSILLFRNKYDISPLCLFQFLSPVEIFSDKGDFLNIKNHCWWQTPPLRDKVHSDWWLASCTHITWYWFLQKHMYISVCNIAYRSTWQIVGSISWFSQLDNIHCIHVSD